MDILLFIAGAVLGSGGIFGFLTIKSRQDKASSINLLNQAEAKAQKIQEKASQKYDETIKAARVEADEIIAIAYKNNTIPYKLIEYYDWQQMNYLIEEEND